MRKIKLIKVITANYYRQPKQVFSFIIENLDKSYLR